MAETQRISFEQLNSVELDIIEGIIIGIGIRNNKTILNIFNNQITKEARKTMAFQIHSLFINDLNG